MVTLSSLSPLTRLAMRGRTTGNRRPLRLGMEALEERQLMSAAPITADDYTRFVNAIYGDLLHRPPQAAELSSAVSALQTGTARNAIARGILTGTEYDSSLVATDSQAFLKRLPTTSEGSTWVQGLQNGMTESRFQAKLLATPEYYGNQGGNNSGWLTGLYRDVFGRAPDAGGLASWTSTLQNGASREAVAYTFVTSPEASGLFVTATFESLLHRDPSAAELSRYVTQMGQGQTTKQVRLTVTASLEYFTIHQTDTVATSTAVNGAVLANVAVTQGWATFGEVLPQGQASSGLQLGDLVTQTDVKTRWSDGSIRYAIVSANVPAAGTYALRAANLSLGTFTPQIPNAAVQFQIGTISYTATLPRQLSSDRWLSGPLVQEARSMVTPVDAQGHAHPFLDVVFDYRAYANGQGRLDVTVENVLDSAAATVVTYDVSIVANGQTLFQQSNVTHYYLTRWRQVFDVGLTASQVTPDFSTFYQANALPRYLNQVTNVVNTPTGDAPARFPWATQPRFSILQGGNLDYYMPDHGERPEIAPYPDWAARYLVHEDPGQRHYVLVNGDLAGSWPIHVRETNGTLVSIDQRPNFWFDIKADPANRPAGSPLPDPSYMHYGPTDPVHQSPLTPDNAHQPSLAYIPYLLTGDRYYADEMKYWADYGLLRTPQNPSSDRGGRQGILFVGNEVRGDAWVIRNLADAAAYLPDSDPMKPYFTQKLNNNLRWLDNWTQTHTGPLGVAWLRLQAFEYDYTNTRAWIKLQQYEFLSWAIDHANQQGFLGGTSMRDQIVRFQLNLFTSPEWQRDNAAPYAIAVGDLVGTKHLSGQDFSGSQQVNYYTTLSQAYTGTFTNSGASRPFADWEGTKARLMLMMAIRNHLPGAQDSYDYLWNFIGTPSGRQASDLARHAGWAIALPNEV